MYFSSSRLHKRVLEHHVLPAQRFKTKETQATCVEQTHQQCEKEQKKMVPDGVEPSTLALLAPRSNRLSYGTLVFVSCNKHVIPTHPESFTRTLTVAGPSQMIQNLKCLRGVVGYHVCFTRTRSPVRTWTKTNNVRSNLFRTFFDFDSHTHTHTHTHMKKKAVVLLVKCWQVNET